MPGGDIMFQEEVVRNQYQLPRFVLNNFAASDGQVWFFNKKTGRSSPTQIGARAAGRRSRSGAPSSGRSSVGQDEAADRQVAAICEKIIRSETLNLAESEREVLSAFFARLLICSPQWQESRGHLNRDVFSGCRRTAEVKLEALSPAEGVDTFSPYFHCKTWVLLKTSEEHPFWISDNPVSLQYLNASADRSGLGMVVRGVELCFPLSRTLCIGMWCSRQEEEFGRLTEEYSYLRRAAPWMFAKVFDNLQLFAHLREGIATGSAVPFAPRNVDRLNAMQAKNSYRYVYASNGNFARLNGQIDNGSTPGQTLSGAVSWFLPAAQSL